MKLVVDVVKARGHPNVRAEHRTTFEITKDRDLTPRGDCIIGVAADKGASDLNPELRDTLRKDTSIVVLKLACRDVADIVVAQGSSSLTLEDGRRIVVRKSSYIGPETLAIRANKAAKDLDRRLIECLRQGEELTVKIIAIDLQKELE